MTGDQNQTRESFGFKWQQRESYGSDAQLDFTRDWLIARYGFGDAQGMANYFASRKRVLDAGCGGAYTAAVLLRDVPVDSEMEYVGVDLSEAVFVARERVTRPRARFVQADLLALPFPKNSFDTIVSEGVLHHTPSTRDALRAVAACLAPGGEIMFYVYRRKGLVRELADDAIRDRVAPLPPEEAWEAMVPLTKLAQALSDAHAEVVVPEDVPLLGISAGRHDVQRLIYNAFCKLFWNDAFTFEENLHVNFDWYHPRYAHRQSEEEVRAWCAELGLEITHMDVQASGITVRAVRS